jgi:hypothetical protein
MHLGSSDKRVCSVHSEENPASDQFPSAFVISDRFQQCDLISASTGVRVWKGMDTKLGREVAIKAVPKCDAQIPWEARIQSKLNHPSILKVLDVLDTKDSWCVIFPWCHQGTLDSKLTDPDWRHEDRVSLFTRLMSAVEYVHEHGYLHCDLKPHNVLLNLRGLPCLSDFGIASRSTEVESQGVGNLTGSPAYMAPELASQSASPSVGSEIYSLGIILRELLTGKRTFSDEWATALREVTHGNLPPLSVDSFLSPQLIPPKSQLRDWNAILTKATSRRPTERFASVREFSEDVHRLISGQAIRARRSSASEKIVRALKREPLLTALLFVTSLVVILAFVVSISFLGVARSQYAKSRASQAASEAIAQKILANQQEINSLLKEYQKETQTALDAKTKVRQINEKMRRTNLELNKRLTETESMKQQRQETIDHLVAVREETSKLEQKIVSERSTQEQLDEITAYGDYWKAIQEARDQLAAGNRLEAAGILEGTDPKIRSLEFAILDAIAYSTVTLVPRHPLFANDRYREHAIANMPNFILAEAKGNNSIRKHVLMRHIDEAKFDVEAEWTSDTRGGTLKFVSGDFHRRFIHVAYSRTDSVAIVTVEKNGETWTPKPTEDFPGVLLSLHSLDSGGFLSLHRIDDRSKPHRSTLELRNSDLQQIVWRKDVTGCKVDLLYEDIVPDHQFVLDLGCKDVRSYKSGQNPKYWVRVKDDGTVLEDVIAEVRRAENDPLLEQALLVEVNQSSGQWRWFDRTISSMSIGNKYGRVDVSGLDERLNAMPNTNAYIEQNDYNLFLGARALSLLSSKSKRLSPETFDRLMEELKVSTTANNIPR